MGGRLDALSLCSLMGLVLWPGLKFRTVEFRETCGDGILT